jgi:hypothetical protein
MDAPNFCFSWYVTGNCIEPCQNYLAYIGRNLKNFFYTLDANLYAKKVIIELLETRIITSRYCAKKKTA